MNFKRRKSAATLNTYISVSSFSLQLFVSSRFVRESYFAPPRYPSSTSSLHSVELVVSKLSKRCVRSGHLGHFVPCPVCKEWGYVKSGNRHLPTISRYKQKTTSFFHYDSIAFRLHFKHDLKPMLNRQIILWSHFIVSWSLILSSIELISFETFLLVVFRKFLRHFKGTMLLKELNIISWQHLSTVQSHL